jgi:hypothetical protein
MLRDMGPLVGSVFGSVIRRDAHSVGPASPITHTGKREPGRAARGLAGRPMLGVLAAFSGQSKLSSLFGPPENLPARGRVRALRSSVRTREISVATSAEFSLCRHSAAMRALMSWSCRLSPTSAPPQICWFGRFKSHPLPEPDKGGRPYRPPRRGSLTDVRLARRGVTPVVLTGQGRSGSLTSKAKGDAMLS